MNNWRFQREKHSRLDCEKYISAIFCVSRAACIDKKKSIPLIHYVSCDLNKNKVGVRRSSEKVSDERNGGDRAVSCTTLSRIQACLLNKKGLLHKNIVRIDNFWECEVARNEK